MTTTFEKFAGATRRNYSDLPTIDVEILPDVHHCKDCDEVVEYKPGAGLYGMGIWTHSDPKAENHNYVSPRTWCNYCHNEDQATVKFRQHAWHDATAAGALGGVDGFAIGD